jgi:hypothetical protein
MARTARSVRSGGLSRLCAWPRQDWGSGITEEITMLTTILLLLVILWFLGMVTSYTLGGFIHLLLVLAVAMVLIRIIQGRSPVV